MKRIILAMLVCLMSIISAMAQITVKGRVTDETGSAIMGTTVKVKDSKIGTVTDLTGYYTLQIPNKEAILEFSAIGVETVEKKYDGKPIINVKFKEKTEKESFNKLIMYDRFGKKVFVVRDFKMPSEKLQFSDIVDEETYEELDSGVYFYVIRDQIQCKTGYLKKGNVNNAEEFVKLRTGANDREIFMINTPKLAGERNKTKIKFSSKGYSSPLIVIDGKVQDVNYDLKELSPDTIKSISVLKGTAAIKAYGEKGRNGVVVIATKK